MGLIVHSPFASIDRTTFTIPKDLIIHKPDNHGLVEPGNWYYIQRGWVGAVTQLIMASNWFVTLSVNTFGFSSMVLGGGLHEPRTADSAIVLTPIEPGELAPFGLEDDSQRIVAISDTEYAFMRLYYDSPYRLQVGFSTVTGIPVPPASYQVINTDGYWQFPCMVRLGDGTYVAVALSATVDSFRIYNLFGSWNLYSTVNAVRSKGLFHYKEGNNLYLVYYTPGSPDALSLLWLEDNLASIAGSGNLNGLLTHPVDSQVIVKKRDGKRDVIVAQKNVGGSVANITVYLDFSSSPSPITYTLGLGTADSFKLLLDATDHPVVIYSEGSSIKAHRVIFPYYGIPLHSNWSGFRWIIPSVTLATGYEGPLDAAIHNNWVTIYCHKSTITYSIHFPVTETFISF